MHPNPLSTRRPRAIVSTTLLVVLLGASVGCSVTKPIACAALYPPARVAGRVLDADSAGAEGESHNDLPTPALVIAAPVLVPLNYIHWLLHGTVAGLVSGVVSDLNMLTGHATWESSLSTLLRPLKTNALPPEEQ